jgi:CRP/FNR family transcriptional regulator
LSLECQTCPVRAKATCSALTEEERNALARLGRTRELKRGELLFAAGDEITACATLISGALKVAAIDIEGTENILALVHPAGFVGELFAPFASYEVTALADSRVCQFSRRDLEEAVRLHPALGVALLQRAQEDLHAARELLDLSRRKGAAARVAGLILAFARAASDSPCHPAQSFDLPLTRGEMAAMLGLTIETISRQLGELEAMGAIARKGARGIDLVSPARLGELAD